MMCFKNGSQPLLLSPTFGRTPYPTSVYAESIVLSFSLINPICLLQWVFVKFIFQFCEQGLRFLFQYHEECQRLKLLMFGPLVW